MSEDISDAEIIVEFKAEALEHLGLVEPLLLTLQTSDDITRKHQVHAIFRAFHSIKGAASSLGLTAAEQISHVLESMLMPVRDGVKEYETPMTDALLLGLDALKSYMLALPEVVELNTEQILAAIAAAARGQSQAAASTLASQKETDEIGPLAGLPSNISPQTAQEAKDQGLLGFWLVWPQPQAEATLAPVLASVLRVGRMAGRRPSNGPVEALAIFSPLDKETLAAALKIDAAWLHPVGGESREAGGESPDTVRVKILHLNALMTQTSQLVLSRNELMTALEGREEFESMLQNLNGVTGDLQTTVMRTRLQSMSILQRRVNRMVYDVARKLGKDVSLRGEGLEVELDRSIVEALTDPLNHLVRNALDHGIELPAERMAAGKRAQGTLILRAHREGGVVTVSVQDDGRGMDPARIKEVALARGVVTGAQLNSMTPADVLALVFLPGFSTAREVSDMSGRGVGMDVVKTNIAELGGKVELTSLLGQGTLVRVHLPMTLAILPGLVFRLGQQRFVVPQVNLVEVVRVTQTELPQRVTHLAGAELLELRGQALPLVWLREITRCADAADPQAPLYVLVLRSGEQALGLVVDAVEDHQEIVVKPLAGVLRSSQLYAGTTVLGDGTVAMILDVNRLAGGAQRTQSALQKHVEDPSTQVPLHDLLLFSGGGWERFAVDLQHVRRVSRVAQADISVTGQQEYVKGNGKPMRLVRFNTLVNGAPLDPSLSFYYVIEPRGMVGRKAWLVEQLIDTVRGHLPETTQGEPRGILGRSVLEGEVITFVDVPTLVATEAMRDG